MLPSLSASWMSAMVPTAAYRPSSRGDQEKASVCLGCSGEGGPALFSLDPNGHDHVGEDHTVVKGEDGKGQLGGLGHGIGCPLSLDWKPVQHASPVSYSTI